MMENNIKKNISIKKITKIVSLLLIVLFFMPLFTVSCSGQEIGFSAARLTTGYSYRGEEVIKAHIICSLLIVLPILVFVIWFIVKNSKIINVAIGGSGLIDIILLISIIAKAKGQAEEMYMDFRTNFAFYLSMILNLVLIAAAALELTGSTSKIPIFRDTSNQETDIRICSQCGAYLKKDYVFCGECGANYEQSNASTKYCTNCGAMLSAEEAFCTSCGTKA